MDYQLLKTAIAEVIKANGNNEITGPLMQSVLLTMVDTLGEGYRFAGVATQAVVPQDSDALLFYIAEGAGSYANFNLSVDKGELAVFFKPSGYGAWVKQSARIGDVGGYKLYSPTVYTYGSLPSTPTDGGLYFLYADRVASGVKYRYIYTSDPDVNAGAWTMFTTEWRVRLGSSESSAAGNAPILASDARMTGYVGNALTEINLEYTAEGNFTEAQFIANAINQPSGEVQELEDIAQNGSGTPVSVFVDDFSTRRYYLSQRWWNNASDWGMQFGDYNNGITIYYDGTYHIIEN